MNISFLNFLHVYTIPHPPPQKCRALFVARNRARFHEIAPQLRLRTTIVEDWRGPRKFSEDAPQRHRGHGDKSFFNYFLSELCALCVSVVNSPNFLVVAPPR
jgi:hypothetical protein